MRFSRIALALGASIAVATTALAQGTTSTERIDQRQENQTRRIEKGVESGQLNKAETRRLERGQERVEKKEARAMKDGKVTKGEQAKIEAAQDVQSARIAKQKHDAQKAHKGEKKPQ